MSRRLGGVSLENYQGFSLFTISIVLVTAGGALVDPWDLQIHAGCDIKGAMELR